MTHRLLTTKLYFPTARAGLLSRPRLVERLEKGLSGPVTLLSAPAGYGKTTLLSEWRAGKGANFPAAWLSLDSGDNDLSRFLFYLAASLDMLQTDLLRDTISLLQLSQPVSAEDAVTSLLLDLNHFPDDFVLVLDDLHLITHPQVHLALHFLLDHLPPRMHLAFLTRADPPLPIARLRARSQLVEIRMEHLRFTQEETQRLFYQWVGVNLNEASIAALDQRAEGWIAGLQLSGLSMQGRSPEGLETFINTFTGSHHYILDYLIEEVLNHLDDSTRDFLLKTSILERLSGPLCSAVSGNANGQTLLEALERGNMFVFPLDEERCWYRYHHLFADALRNRLVFFSSGSLRELHHRAAEWFEQNELVEESARHAQLAGDFLRVARLIQLHWLNMMNQGQLSQVMEWQNAIPEAVMQSRPNLFVIKAWTFWFRGNIEEAGNHLQRAIQALERVMTSGGVLDPWIDEDCQALSAEIQAFESLIWTSKGQFERAVSLAKQALAAYPDHQAIGGVAYVSLFNAYKEMGYMEEAIAACKQSIASARARGVRITEATSLYGLARSYRIQGHLRLAAETCLDMIRPAEQLGTPLPFPFSPLYIALAEILMEWNDLDQARQILELGFKQTERVGLASYWAHHVTQAELFGCQGEWQRALEVLDGVLMTARTTQALSVIAELEVHRVKILVRLGRIKEAENWASAVQSLIHIGERIGSQMAVWSLVVARVWTAAGKMQEAQELLAKIEMAAHAGGSVRWEIEALLLHAVILCEQKAYPEALSCLEKALTLAEEEGFARVFLNEGDPILDLLQQSRQNGNRYAAKLMSFIDKNEPVVQNAPSAHPTAASEPVSHTGFIQERLSKREIEVLRLIADGCANKEISSLLFISIGTVKRHVIHILRKLDAANRTQAVVMAREQKII